LIIKQSITENNSGFQILLTLFTANSFNLENNLLIEHFQIDTIKIDFFLKLRNKVKKVQIKNSFTTSKSIS